ncbi:MAG TPA: PQQ-dependent sugar dehydrogenase, partial [Candidatus Thermoplasmatota archaeon]|nr:PQQ-dependent sugar dehydrogenase [Candidatus Thermoplasmatota archaeon]
AGEPDRELFAMGQPYANHNGGTVTFGPDGRLYLGLGDGGGAGDPRGHAQSKDIRLGKVLRFDVDSFPSGPAVPAAGNPFYERGGDRAIWVYGVRNPWRFSFDRATGDLWVADVGQNEWEEVNVLRSGRQAGANLGWDKFEGRQRFEQGDAPGHVPPVHVYSHAGGRCSVTGGFVYRGSAIPGLAGQYVFGDYCSGEVWALDAARPREAHLLLRVDDRLASFGEDAAGELYVVGHGGSVHRLVAAD